MKTDESCSHLFNREKAGWPCFNCGALGRPLAAMSEPIMELVEQLRGATAMLQFKQARDVYAAIEREVAALRERAERWQGAAELAERAQARAEQRIADLEAERAALMAQKKKADSLVREALATLRMWADVAPAISFCKDIEEYLESQPGALAAWMAQEGR